MDDVSLAVLSSQNPLPPIDTLQLVDRAANTGQTAQERAILDEMAGLTSSSTDQSSGTLPYNVLDLFSQDNLDGWNDLLLPSSGGQVPMPVRYGQYEYQDQQAVNASLDETNGVRTSFPSDQKRSRPVRDDQRRGDRQKVQHAGTVIIKKKRKPLPHVCQHPGCTARFQQLQHLKTHMASHQGIKPFRCDFEGCNRNFSQKGNLKVSFHYCGVDGRHTRENILEKSRSCVKNVIRPSPKREIYRLIRACTLDPNHMCV